MTMSTERGLYKGNMEGCESEGMCGCWEEAVSAACFRLPEWRRVFKDGQWIDRDCEVAVCRNHYQHFSPEYDSLK